MRLLILEVQIAYYRAKAFVCGRIAKMLYTIIGEEASS